MAKAKINISVKAKRPKRKPSAKRRNKTNRKSRGGKGNRVVTDSGPLARSMVIRSTKNTPSYKRSGTSFLANVNIPTGTPDSVLLFDEPIGPQLFPGSVLDNLDRSFAKWRFTKFDVKIGGNVPMTVIGGYIAGISPDPSEIVTTGGLKDTILSMDGAIGASLWDQKSCSLNCGGNSQPFLFTTANYPRAGLLNLQTTRQGKLFVVTNGVSGGYTGSITIPLIADWTIEYIEPVARGLPESSGTLALPLPISSSGDIALFVIDANGSNSGMSVAGQVDEAAAVFVENMLQQMEDYSKCVYITEFPADGGYTTNQAAQYFLWKKVADSTPRIYFAGVVVSAFTDASTNTGTGTPFQWFGTGRSGNAIPDPIQTTVVFHAIRNPSYVGPVTSYKRISHQNPKPVQGEGSSPAVAGPSHSTLESVSGLVELLAQLMTERKEKTCANASLELPQSQ